MRTSDLKFTQLCDEIDHWKDEAMYWKDRHDKLMAEYMQQSNENLTNAKKGVADALMLAFCIKDDSEGNLVVSKEDRIALANRYK